MPNYTPILAKLKGLKRTKDGWQALCPAHEDHNASLSLRVADDDRLLLKCHAGCATEAIVAALGLEMSALFADAGNKSKPKQRIVQTYDYEDVDGKLIFQVVRFEPKGFRQRRPNPEISGEWIWDLKGVQPVPYRMPMLHHTPRDRHVWIVDGEKDVDQLVMDGLIATCNPGGCGKWRAAYNEVFRGRPVIIIPDNDPFDKTGLSPGLKHAADVAEQLRPVAQSVTILMLPGLPEKGDVSDYLDSHKVDELVELARKAEADDPPQAAPAPAQVPQPAASVPEEREDEIKREVSRRTLLMLETAEGMLHDTIKRFFENIKQMCEVKR